MTRGCGERVENGVYVVVPESPNGHPIEEFLCCEPYAPEPEPGQQDLITRLGLTPVAPRILNTVSDVFLLDWVGETHYPNVADVVEEARVKGISRRMPKNLGWSALSPAAKLVMVHARAQIVNPEHYHRNPVSGEVGAEYYQRATRCPHIVGLEHCGKRPKAAHGPGYTGMCCRLWYQDVDDGEPVQDTPRLVNRTIGDMTYLAYRRPTSDSLLRLETPAYTWQPFYRPAIFAVFPIGGIEVVNGDQASDIAGRIADQVRGGLAVSIVDA